MTEETTKTEEKEPTLPENTPKPKGQALPATLSAENAELKQRVLTLETEYKKLDESHMELTNRHGEVVQVHKQQLSAAKKEINSLKAALQKKSE